MLTHGNSSTELRSLKAHRRQKRLYDELPMHPNLLCPYCAILVDCCTLSSNDHVLPLYTRMFLLPFAMLVQRYYQEMPSCTPFASPAVYISFDGRDVNHVGFSVLFIFD